MEPVSAFGIASGALQTIHVIGSSILGLQSLSGKYSEAEQTIQSLIVELSTIQTALQRLTNYCEVQGRFDHPDCLSDLRVAVEGCQLAMEVFSDEISRLLRSNSPHGQAPGEQLGFRTRMRIAWNDQLMNDLHQRLHAQVLALNLLLQACQCRTPSEQLELLRQEDNRRLIKRVADDTATLQSTRSATNSRIGSATASAQNSGASSIGRTSFSFDDNVVDSDAYRWVMNQQRLQSPSDENGVDVPGQVSSHPQLLISACGDGGHASGSVQYPNPAPNFLRVPDAVRSLETAQDTRLCLRVRGDVLGSRSEALARASSIAHQHLGRPKSTAVPTLLKSPWPKRNPFRSAIERVSLRRGGAGSTSSFSTTDSRQLKRYRQNESSVSVDITSASGVTAPAIVKAAQAGATKEVEIQIESGADMEARHDDSGRTALAVAAHCGKEEVVSLLLLKNAKVETRDSCMMTPLHLAASRGHSGVLQILLREDIDVDAKDYKGRTAFWIAADAGYLEAAKIILNCGGAINSRAEDQMTALHRAARRGDRETVFFLLRCNHVDVNSKDSKMRTALHDASEAGHPEIVGMLLKSGSNIEAPGEFQATPLICAAAMGHLPTTKLLLKRGALVNASDEKGMTALHWAAFKGYDEVVEQLFKRKMPVNLTDNRGCTPLHLAICGRQFPVAESILRQDSSTESRCWDGYTPLHYACNTGNIELVRLLLYSKANIEAQVKGSGRRAVHLTAHFGSLEIFKLLQAKGADVDCVDLSGFTPLCVASKYGQLDVVNWLLISGASPRPQTTYHTSPVRAAAMEGHVQIVTRLVDAGASPSECGDIDWNTLLHASHYGHFGVSRYLLRRNLTNGVSEPSADLGQCSRMQPGRRNFVLPPASMIPYQQGDDYNVAASRRLISLPQELIPPGYPPILPYPRWYTSSCPSGLPLDSLPRSFDTEDSVASLHEPVSDDGSYGCEVLEEDARRTPTVCQNEVQPLIDWGLVGEQDDEMTDSDSVRSFCTAHEYINDTVPERFEMCELEQAVSVPPETLSQHVM